MKISPTNPRTDYVFLSIDQLNSIDSTSNAGMNFAFAKLYFTDNTSNVQYLDERLNNFGTVPLQNPIATLDKLNIRIIDSSGILVDQNGNNHNFTIKFYCGDNIPKGGGSTITHGGRILGGTQ
jgi:hypothetical protein